MREQNVCYSRAPLVSLKSFRHYCSKVFWDQLSVSQLNVTLLMEGIQLNVLEAITIFPQ